MANGRRVAESDDFMLYLMAIVIIGIGAVVALAYAVYLFASLASFIVYALHQGVG